MEVRQDKVIDLEGSFGALLGGFGRSTTPNGLQAGNDLLGLVGLGNFNSKPKNTTINVTYSIYDYDSKAGTMTFKDTVSSFRVPINRGEMRSDGSFYGPLNSDIYKKIESVRNLRK
jgi:hypothetical protein